MLAPSAGTVVDAVIDLLAIAQSFKHADYFEATERGYKSQTVCYVKFLINFGLVPVAASQETLVSYCLLLSSFSQCKLNQYLFKCGTTHAY